MPIHPDKFPNTSEYLDLEPLLINEIEDFVSFRSLFDILNQEDPRGTLDLIYTGILDAIDLCDRSTEGREEMVGRITAAVNEAYSVSIKNIQCRFPQSPDES